MGSRSKTSATDHGEGSGSKKGEAIDDLLQRLGIEDDEIDDLIFEDEETAPKEGIKWLALARVHTTNFFGPLTFEQHMKTAWSLAKEVIFQALEQNLFTIQCHCLGDWQKIEQGGPWLFRQNAVIIEPYDGLSAIESVELNKIAVWLQIHKLPIGYRDEALIRNLVQKKVGPVSTVETQIAGIRVKLDVHKPLARFVSIARGGQREYYQIKFEKIPRFCGACGFLGYTHLECGTGEHDESKLKWGDFLKADLSTWRGRSMGGFRGTARGNQGRDGGGRGGRDPRGRGRYQSASWRHNALAYVDGKALPDDPLADTASSPSKMMDIEKDDRDSTESGVKRRLNLEDGKLSEEECSDTGNGTVLPMFTDGQHSLDVGNTDGKNMMDRNKRTKKDGASSPSLGSADSREESVPSQRNSQV
jgi:hypothetical protein